jgi:hypothetical protein
VLHRPWPSNADGRQVGHQLAEIAMAGGGLSWAMRCVKPSYRVRLDRFSYAGIEVPRLMPVYPVAGFLPRLFDIFKVSDEAFSLLAEGLAEAVDDLAVE